MGRRAWIKLGILVACLASLFWGLRALGIRPDDVTPDKVRTLILSFGVWAPIVYLAAYGQPIVPLPASIMTITGGLAFGPLWGTVAALAGATVRACNEFLIARLLGRQAVERLLRGKLAAWDAKLAANGFTAVLLIRLVPNLPFDLQNYGLGFSRVRFSAYAPATVLGMIPGSFAYVYLGYSLTDPKQLWKLGLAVLLILGLVVLQRLIARRGGTPGSSS